MCEVLGLIPSTTRKKKKLSKSCIWHKLVPLMVLSAAGTGKEGPEESGETLSGRAGSSQLRFLRQDKAVH